ncbi:MAG: hypothetical protein UW46_C0001G0145 [Candidatus Yanofskybacteria bacterium GW2011_GWF1_44_227]|uniref:Uncharacterized protein n=1 Tax=Candidatus Yanofskybacteria bacterium GW2011_GWE2_40_11 TaxID=1619033 RepID=A0A0G0QUY9_9BACT|nr:MAG: hypothetical protein UT69_C0013G0074 [Candidatus Yanofskybacteria bacterium GW2011_GWE1_40_10]KKR41171.1 MAG: hypothetical protein UT75_C0001G0075 [Candidatus Yanofskybacteria bacterium GW2011_GWE2_40_11]KKT15832.1 MAG: hypothetical protein UV97_C0001G0005 [Candidatus Yanofskybacteria bacterium GW2011_GWF2_43_596]KKT53655.1 MAG: hypothetical protein UW46_C0001G0145 [Candidatus Yanofskybacteria bacterium GW2011_GWF1_44_227]OGN36222.1 MAG: hypothetical protein A2241_00550 [Candidatus Yano
MPESKTLREGLAISILDDIQGESVVVKSALENLRIAEEVVRRHEAELATQKAIVLEQKAWVADSMAKLRKLVMDRKPYYAGAYCACVINTIGSSAISTILATYETNSERTDFMMGMIDCLAGASDNGLT